MSLRHFVLCAFLGFTFACGRIAPAGSGGGAALMRNLERARTLEIVAEERELHGSLERAAARLRAADSFRRFDAVVTEGFPARSKVTPRIVVGTRKSNRAWLLAERVGVVMMRDDAVPTFRFGRETFDAASDGFTATFEDPERPGLPVTLVFANSVETAQELSRHATPGWQPWIRVTHGLELAREGPLALDGKERPLELASRMRLRAARDAYLVRSEFSPTGLDMRVAPTLASDVIEKYAAACSRACASARAWIQDEASPRPIEVRVWSRAVDYLEDGDPNTLSKHDPLLARVETVILGTCDDGGAGAAQAQAWSALGAPAEPWMADAAGLEAAWSWWGRALDPWLTRIAGGERSVSIDDLVASDASARTSAHVVAPLRAALWRFVREKHGDAHARAVWRGTRELSTSSEEDAAFKLWLEARLSGAARVEDVAQRDLQRVKRRDALALRGVGASEFEPMTGRAIARGLDSAESIQALSAARAIGADAFLVASHAVDRPGAQAHFRDAARNVLAPREGDVRIASVLLDASSRGMQTVLSANLLSGDGGTWSGTWTRGNERGWNEFFERYERFVEHNAALAELSGAAVLSIGTGLMDVTSTNEFGRRPNPNEAAWKLAGWTRVIHAARRAYDGCLTYTAGSILEVDLVPFYADLDFVAAEMSPTLDLDDASDGIDARTEITRANEQLLVALEAKARATGKRILLTEVCFSPALEGAARRLAIGHTFLDWQAQQFLDLAERLKTWSGTPLLAGVFAWRLRGSDEADYAPVVDSPRVLDAVRVLFQTLPQAR